MIKTCFFTNGKFFSFLKYYIDFTEQGTLFSENFSFIAVNYSRFITNTPLYTTAYCKSMNFKNYYEDIKIIFRNEVLEVGIAILLRK